MTQWCFDCGRPIDPHEVSFSHLPHCHECGQPFTAPEPHWTDFDIGYDEFGRAEYKGVSPRGSA